MPSPLVLQGIGADVDCYINTAAANSNYGTSPVAAVGEISAGAATRRWLSKFDVSSITASATCTAATLELYCYADYSSNARAFRVYRMKQAWAEGTKNGGTGPDGATWNTYNGTNAWPGGAGAFTATDCEQTDIGARTFSATETVNEWKSWTLTASAVQDWWDGGLTNNGILLKADTESDDSYYFYSSDYGTTPEETALRPKLTITYTDGSAATVPVWLLQHRSIGIGLGGPHA